MDWRKELEVQIMLVSVHCSNCSLQWSSKGRKETGFNKRSLIVKRPCALNVFYGSGSQVLVHKKGMNPLLFFMNLITGQHIKQNLQTNPKVFVLMSQAHKNFFYQFPSIERWLWRGWEVEIFGKGLWWRIQPDLRLESKILHSLHQPGEW